MLKLPLGSCDTHCHVIGPHERFEMIPSAGDIRSDSVERHLSMMDSLGLSRAVIVHPSSVYGDDHAALLNALAVGGERYRGVAVAKPSVRDETFAQWKAAGVRALRFVAVKDAQGRPFAGSADFNDLQLLAPRMRDFGFHAHIWANAADLVAHETLLSRLHIPVVLDHMGKMDVAQGVNAPDFARLISMLRDGLLWVKLSLCRNSRAFPDYEDLRPFHDAFMAANPAQLLWGSDWPHIRMGAQTPDTEALLKTFFAFVGDDELAQKILVQNPETLFGFTPMAGA